ncbi:hypothetical protein [Nocardia salmonicida]|uniref:hypothetical protein n=1 Tax=Nocardia salmonicida TaxID=53431 RepID=UPI0007A3BD63|nr:hypothetical protein [Nocardia salmonicida]
MQAGEFEEVKTAESVFGELKLLKRGHGLHAADIAVRMGPALRAVCGVAESDSPGDARRKLVRRLSEECALLPETLRDAARTALAVETADRATPHAFLNQRVQDLATRIDREPRTALRRIDHAFRILAESLAHTETVRPATGYRWHTERLSTELKLDHEPPRLIENRRIVATVPALDEIVIPYSAPRDDADETLTAMVRRGGEIVDRHRISRSHVQFRIRLARTLTEGDRHDLTTEVELYRREQLGTYCVITPWRPCHAFRIRIAFGNFPVPQSVWRIDGIPPVALRDNESSGELLRPGPAGTVDAEFVALRPSMSYGIGWAL